MLTQEQLKSVLNYNSDTGVFIWRRIEHQFYGKEAGTITIQAKPDRDTAQVYRKIGIRGTQYYSHRLAWLYIHGVMPEYIDHENGNGCDNRLSNLRISTKSQNAANSFMLERGVTYLLARDRYWARIKIDGETISLSTYSTRDMAQRAYNEAATILFGEFARHNRLGG